jgi:hypothetical protein
MVLVALKKLYRPESHFNYVDLIDGTERDAVDKGFYKDAHTYYIFSTQHLMPKEDREKVRQIIWDLVMAGILVPGADEHNLKLDYLRVTPYGAAVLSSNQYIPYDPDGYLKEIKIKIPNLDPVIETYIVESLQTFIRGNYLASAVMLGVASEKGILLLIEAYINAIDDASRKEKMQKEMDESFSILSKFKVLDREFNLIKKDLRANVADDIDIQVNSIFNLIRITRNDAGHPTEAKIDRRRAYSNLQVFAEYCKRIYDLIDYFKKTPVK